MLIACFACAAMQDLCECSIGAPGVSLGMLGRLFAGVGWPLPAVGRVVPLEEALVDCTIQRIAWYGNVVLLCVRP